MIIDYSILALIGILIGGFIIGGKWYWQYRLKSEKMIERQEREAQKPENKIDELLQHLPEILQDRKRLYEEAIMKDGKDSQMAKSLQQQVQMLETVVSIPQPVLEFAKPILMKGIALLQRFVR